MTDLEILQRCVGLDVDIQQARRVGAPMRPVLEGFARDLIAEETARLRRAEAELEELRARVGHFGQWASAYKILLGNAVVLAGECADLLSGHDELVERLDRFVIEAEGYK